MADIYVITRSFSATLNGVPHIFRKGDTVREGHEVFRLYRTSLELIKPTYEYEAPKPPPVKATPPPPAKKAVAPPVVKAAVPPASAKTD